MYISEIKENDGDTLGEEADRPAEASRWTRNRCWCISEIKENDGKISGEPEADRANRTANKLVTFNDRSWEGKEEEYVDSGSEWARTSDDADIHLSFYVNYNVR